jgi:hypothetical protein
MRIIDQIPLAALFILTIVFIIVAIEAGFRLASYMRSRGKPENEAPISTMVQSTLALVAFMVAFTFGVAAERFNERRVLIIEEASSICTAFERAELLPEANKKEVQNLLRQYVDLRVKVQPYSKNSKEMITESARLHDRLWTEAVAISKMSLNPAVVGLFINSVNETTVLQSKRVAAGLYARIPEHIWAALYLMILLGMTAAGYQAGKYGSRSWLVSIILTVSFAIVMTLIADLDNPTEGFLEASRRPLIDLQDKIGLPSRDAAASPMH